MAKKQNKVQKEETLETILFNCRNSLRGRAAMTDTRDLLLTELYEVVGIVKSLNILSGIYLCIVSFGCVGVVHQVIFFR